MTKNIMKSYLAGLDRYPKEMCDKARSEFEKWVSAQYGDAVSLSHDGLLYAEPFVMALFIGWQAAKEQYAPREKELLAKGD